MQKTLLGVAERIDLPDWGVDRLRAKVDTGARTSALHVDAIERLPGGRVRFTVVLDRKREHRRVVVETDIAREAVVRASSGEAQRRIFVETTMRLGPVEKTIEVSLASRAPMMFRMLLGRTALSHDFLVDPAYRYLQRARPTKKKRARALDQEPRSNAGGTPSTTTNPSPSTATPEASEPPRRTRASRKGTSSTPRKKTTSKKTTA